ncbi:hypothetical protein PCH_Pc16g13270 [Penicillium rubens Wisconsin 54-1255]|uniref:Uncharacterized protein n=1 Tax=Penicillium rubens (strain ATCC 28089 / DSM 1075 / NRRL 1951 / Wisconsin 54-1255) TaxID=500485 RepID=B6HAL8_PENRW|nr:hypothetical protein PCH_Pc16g13270 [Penicillium rubens Wisconsin 54-1255]
MVARVRLVKRPGRICPTEDRDEVRGAGKDTTAVVTISGFVHALGSSVTDGDFSAEFTKERQGVTGTPESNFEGKGYQNAMNVKEEVIESRRISWLHITTCNWSEIAKRSRRYLAMACSLSIHTRSCYPARHILFATEGQSSVLKMTLCDESFGRRGTVDFRIHDHSRRSFHLRLGTVGAERYRGQITSGSEGEGVWEYERGRAVCLSIHGWILSA